MIRFYVGIQAENGGENVPNFFEVNKVTFIERYS